MGASYFPNTPLVNQDGKQVRFFDDLIKDKVVAINFIFTGCSDSCPVETARLRQVQKILGDRVGKDIFLYSISIDPYNDTPATLKRYAESSASAPAGPCSPASLMILNSCVGAWACTSKAWRTADPGTTT